jgi:type III secretory pathway component EscS
MATMSINATAVRAGTGLRSRGRVVPWLTVVPLAVVMAFADGFWMVSLRGAVGSIERTQEPTVTWLRESALSLPIFVLAVVAALALAARWFSPARPVWRTLLATVLLVVVAGTLVGIAEVAASSAYDYHLQTSRAQPMGSASMGSGSMGADSMVAGPAAAAASLGATAQEHASLEFQVRSVAYGSGLLLVTNLLLVGWVVALRGGRLNVSPLTEPRASSVKPGSATRITLSPLVPCGRCSDESAGDKDRPGPPG